MSFSKHKLFKSRILAVIFLFLNAVCIASPVVKNTFQDHTQLISFSLGHNAESEESQLPDFSFINHHTQRFFLLKKDNCSADLIDKVAILPGKKWSDSITASDLLPKPAYYSFLFLYTLF